MNATVIKIHTKIAVFLVILFNFFLILKTNTAAGPEEWVHGYEPEWFMGKAKGPKMKTVAWLLSQKNYYKELFLSLRPVTWSFSIGSIFGSARRMSGAFLLLSCESQNKLSWEAL